MIEELNRGERRFHGFSDEALYLQRELKDEGWARKSWDENSSEIWAKEIKPQLSNLLSDCAGPLSSITGQDLVFRLGSPYPRHVAKWFWGAVIPKGGKLQHEAQLFVALRWGYVRVGLYLSNRNQDKFSTAISNLSLREEDVAHSLEIARKNDVKLCYTPNESSGSVIEYTKSASTWAKEFQKRKEIDLLKAWKLDDDVLRGPEFAEDVLRVFSSLLPLYEIL